MWGKREGGARGKIGIKISSNQYLIWQYKAINTSKPVGKKAKRKPKDNYLDGLVKWDKQGKIQA